MKLLSCIQLFETPWTAAHKAPLSMGFSRKEYWSGVPLPSPQNQRVEDKNQYVCLEVKTYQMLISNFHDNNGSLCANDRLNRIEIIDFYLPDFVTAICLGFIFGFLFLDICFNLT